MARDAKNLIDIINFLSIINWLTGMARSYDVEDLKNAVLGEKPWGSPYLCSNLFLVIRGWCCEFCNNDLKIVNVGAVWERAVEDVAVR